MNAEPQNPKWGLAYVRKSPLPPDQIWTEAPFYTYLIGEDKRQLYKAMRKDRPVSAEEVERFPVWSFTDSPVAIKPDEAVFIDWEGNYFIGKDSDVERSLTRKIIYRGQRSAPPPEVKEPPVEYIFISPKTLERIGQQPFRQKPIAYASVA
jgi:hypothetical protein